MGCRGWGKMKLGFSSAPRIYHTKEARSDSRQRKDPIN
jgi:hypothetical protein